MSRALSSSALRAMFAEETGDYPILLITLSHETLSDPIRVSSDPTVRLSETVDDVIYGTVSRGVDYPFLPFQITLPGDFEDSAPRSQISIDNVSRELVAAIRSIYSPPQVTMELVMASSVDFVEATFPDFDLSDIDGDSMVISGTLSVDLLVSEPFPSGVFTPGQFPGMF